MGTDAPPEPYPDPNVIVVDPLFNKYRVNNNAIVRLWTGGLWSEGPAWSGQGRYLVWSDLPNNRQMRWLQDDGRITVFRQPSNNGNGNTFDFQGRQLTCEHLTRRVVRYEHNSSSYRDRRQLQRQALSTGRTVLRRTPTAARRIASRLSV